MDLLISTEKLLAIEHTRILALESKKLNKLESCARIACAANIRFQITRDLDTKHSAFQQHTIFIRV
jgi:hypothetical protein